MQCASLLQVTAERSTRRSSVPLFALAALASALIAVPLAQAKPQSGSEQSVAEAARKAREQKKKSQKPAVTLTDDDLAQKKAAAAAAGAEATAEVPSNTGQAAETGAAQGAAAGETPAAASKEQIAKQEAELKALKLQLADVQKDLDLLQRDFALQRDTFYSSPDYSHDKDGKARLDSMQNQMSDKQQEIDRLKTRITALQELIGRSKPASSAEKPAAPPKS